MVAILGFVSAVVYGASDFLGGLASRRMSALLASFLGFVVAAVVSAVAVLIEQPVWSTDAVVLGALAGVAGSVGTWALYACLAIGPMSVLSPGVAAIYAILPAVVGIVLGERFPPVGYAALLVAVVAGILLAATPESGQGRRPSGRGLAYAALSGVAFAGYIIAIDATPAESGLVPLLVDLLVGGLLFVAALVWGRIRRGPAELAGLRDRRAVLLAVVAGALLVAGNIMLVVGLHLGDLAVMAVLNSLYPLGTVLLAIVLLRERLTVLQGVGIGLAIAAAVTLSVVTA
ncbi:MAG TPA: EamA family transporter [Pseudolysinimonas sp.]|nr:EamA family transporter [Pseudolysinimonas sp.]